METKKHDQYIKNINRQVSVVVAEFLFHKTALSANQLTWIRIILGVLGGLMFLIDSYGAVLFGAVLVQMFSTLDAADGELAKRRGSTMEGAWIDSQADNLILIFVFICLAIRFANLSTQPVLMSLWTMLTLCLMFAVRKTLSQSKRTLQKLQEGKGEVKEEESDAQEEKMQSFNRILNHVAFPSPAFYFPVILLFAILNLLIWGVLFLTFYLVLGYVFILYRTYRACVQYDQRKGEL